MQLAAAKTVIEKGLSVRRAEALAAQLPEIFCGCFPERDRGFRGSVECQSWCLCLLILCVSVSAADGLERKTVIEKGLSVRRAEALAAQLLKDTQEKPAKKAAGVDYPRRCARHLEQVLGRKVRMTQGRKTGRIELEYYDADDREALLQALEAGR